MASNVTGAKPLTENDQTGESDPFSRRFQVFVILQCDKKAEVRTLTSQILLEVNCFPVGTDFPTVSDSQDENYSSTLIEDSDFVLVIVGLNSEADDKKRSELEYNRALNLEKTIFVFIERDGGDHLRALSKKTNAGRNLEKFAPSNCVEWSTTDILNAKLKSSLLGEILKNRHKGWIRNEKSVFNISRQMPESFTANDEELLPEEIDMVGFNLDVRYDSCKSNHSNSTNAAPTAGKRIKCKVQLSMREIFLIFAKVLDENSKETSLKQALKLKLHEMASPGDPGGLTKADSEFTVLRNIDIRGLLDVFISRKLIVEKRGVTWGVTNSGLKYICDDIAKRIKY